MATASLNLNDSVRNRIQNLAEKRRRTAHWLMTDAILQYLDYEESIDNLRQEAYRSWENFQIDGLHLTFEELQIWLDDCATSKEVKELPKCHA